MKKTLSVILSALMLISVLVLLPSCGSGKDASPASETEDESVIEGGLMEETDKNAGSKKDKKSNKKTDGNQKTSAKPKTEQKKLEPSTSQTRKKNLEKTRPASLDFKAIADEYGTVSAYECADFDGDGSNEAFAVITNADETIAGVVFVDSYGRAMVMENSLEWMLYASENGNLIMHEGKGFFWADMGAGGSGWKTMVYSVKNGMPYKLDISDQLQGFYEDKGRIYTTEDEFTDKGHIYNSIELIYDSKTQQFKKGGKIETEN